MSEPKVLVISPWLAGVAATVVAAVAIAAPGLYVRGVAKSKTEAHDTSDRSHVVQHRTSAADRAQIHEQQARFVVEIEHIKNNQGDIKEWLRKIDGKLDR